MSRFFANSDHVVDEPGAVDAPSSPSLLYPNSATSDRREALRQEIGGASESISEPAAPKPPPPQSQEQAEPKAEPTIEVPDAVAKLRQSDPSFYDVLGTYRSVLGTGTSQDILPGQPEPVRREVATMFRDAALTDAEAQLVVDALKAQPADEVRAQWERDGERYLGTLSDQDVEDASKFLERDPRVERILESTGAINNPEVMRLVVDKARAERLRGRL